MNLHEISLSFKKSEALRPSVLLAIGTLFLLAISSFIPGAKALLVIAFSIFFFAIGEFYSKKFKPKLDIKKETMFYAGIFIFLVSLAALYLNFFTAGGIPLFNTAIRRFLNPILTYTSFLMVPASLLIIASIPKKSYPRLKTLALIFFTAGMMALLGYRTEVLAILIAGTLVAYYTEIFQLKELIILFLVAILAFGGVTFVRAGGIENSLIGRATATFTVFDLVVEQTPLFGLTKGYVQFADLFDIVSETPIYSGRVLIASIIGSRIGVSITSTLFAPPFVDFGILAAVVFIIFGLILGAGYKAAKEKKGVYAVTHSLLLTFLLLGIETGIVDLIIWVYFFFIAMFYIIAHNYG